MRDYFFYRYNLNYWILDHGTTQAMAKKVRPGFKKFLFSDFNTSPKFISTETTMTDNDIALETMGLVISSDRTRNLITFSIFENY